MCDREILCATKSFVRPMEVDLGFRYLGSFRGVVLLSGLFLRELGGYLGFGLISP